MKRQPTIYSRLLATMALTLLAGNILAALGQTDLLHTPAMGTPERKALMDAMRAYWKAEGNDADVIFKVNFLKVHNGWAWVDVTPLDSKTNKPIAEGGTSLLHNENGQWSVMDISKVPEDPDDPMGPMSASPGFKRELKKIYPGVPLDIFPRYQK